SSTAAENESERSSTCSRSSFQDLKPYSRAITNCASCKAMLSWVSERPVRIAWNLTKRGRFLVSRRVKQRFGLFLELLQIGALRQRLPRHKGLHAWSLGSHQAARDLDVHSASD